MPNQDILLEIQNHNRDQLYLEVKPTEKDQETYKLSLGSKDDEHLGKNADIPPRRIVRQVVWDKFMADPKIAGLVQNNDITVRGAPNGTTARDTNPCLEW